MNNRIDHDASDSYVNVGGLGEREGIRGDCKRSTIGIFLEGRRTDRIYYSNRKPTPCRSRPRNLLLKYDCLFAIGIAIRPPSLAENLFRKHYFHTGYIIEYKANITYNNTQVVIRSISFAPLLIGG